MPVFRGALRLLKYLERVALGSAGGAAALARRLVHRRPAAAQRRLHVKHFVRLRRVRHVLAQSALAGRRRGGRHALAGERLVGAGVGGVVAAQVALGFLLLLLLLHLLLLVVGGFGDAGHDVAAAEAGERGAEPRRAAVFREQDGRERRRLLRFRRRAAAVNSQSEPLAVLVALLAAFLLSHRKIGRSLKKHKKKQRQSVTDCIDSV